MRPGQAQFVPQEIGKRHADRNGAVLLASIHR
jgi:hypothetical protein